MVNSGQKTDVYAQDSRKDRTATLFFNTIAVIGLPVYPSQTNTSPLVHTLEHHVTPPRTGRTDAHVHSLVTFEKKKKKKFTDFKLNNLPGHLIRQPPTLAIIRSFRVPSEFFPVPTPFPREQSPRRKGPVLGPGYRLGTQTRTKQELKE